MNAGEIDDDNNGDNRTGRTSKDGDEDVEQAPGRTKHTEQVRLGTESDKSPSHNETKEAVAFGEDEDISPKRSAERNEETMRPIRKKRMKNLGVKLTISSRKKPRDAPKRPLSAYNIFFKEQRALLMERNDQGVPDEDFRIDLDALVVANGKPRNDPAAIFQAAARTLAKRWKTMDPKEKENYETSAAKEMESYREKVIEYENRMLKEAKEREKNQGSDDTIARRTDPTALKMNHSSQEMENDSYRSVEAKVDGVERDPVRFQSTNMAPSIMDQAALSATQLFSADTQHLAPFGQDQSLLQSLTMPTSFLFYPGQAPAAVTAPSLSMTTRQLSPYEASILALLQRENILQQGLDMARAVNAPVVTTVLLPDASVSQQLLVQLAQADSSNYQGSFLTPFVPSLLHPHPGETPTYEYC